MLITFFLFSCGKEEIITEPVVFLKTSNVLFQYDCNDNNITFFLDVLEDVSDGTTGTWPNTDVYRIYIDYNNNGILDSELDLIISTVDDGSTCMAYSLSQTSTTGCNFYDDVTSEKAFSSTDNLEVPHMNYTIIVPKARASEGSKIKVAIHIYNSESGWSKFPSDQDLFLDAFELEW